MTEKNRNRSSTPTRQKSKSTKKSTGKLPKSSSTRSTSQLAINRPSASTKYMQESYANRTMDCVREKENKAQPRTSALTKKKHKLSLNNWNSTRPTVPTQQDEIAGDKGGVSRQMLQARVESLCLKAHITAQQLMGIVSGYEALLDQSDPTFRPEKLAEQVVLSPTLKGPKKMICPGVNLSAAKAANIPDYNDEFMSHYDELSQSWKRDIAKQRRY